MTDPLMMRLSEAVQQKYDADLALLEVADELREFASRAVGETSRIQKALKGGLDAPGVMKLPRVLQSGPKRHDDGLPSDVEATA